MYLKNTECALVSHPDESAEAELEHKTLLVASEVANILQDEELWAVVITILKWKEINRIGKQNNLGKKVQALIKFRGLTNMFGEIW